MKFEEKFPRETVGFCKDCIKLLEKLSGEYEICLVDTKNGRPKEEFLDKQKVREVIKDFEKAFELQKDINGNIIGQPFLWSDFDIQIKRLKKELGL